MLPGYKGGSFTAVIGDNDAPEVVFTPDEGVELEPADPEVSEATDLRDLLDTYTRFSVDQLALVMSQRDAERQSHEDCHEGFEAHLAREVKKARLRGHAESLCAGLYNRHIMGIPHDKRDAIYRQARSTIEHIDNVEALYESQRR
jgi:hypothetical protein